MVRKHDPDSAHLRVRLDSRLRRRLEQAAKRNNASMNAEIVDRLEKSFAIGDVRQAVMDVTADLTRVIAAQTANTISKDMAAGLFRGTVVETLIDRAVEQVIAGGSSLSEATHPWWMQLDWAKRHPEHPEAVRIMEQDQKAIVEGYEKFVREQGKNVRRKERKE